MRIVGLKKVYLDSHSICLSWSPIIHWVSFSLWRGEKWKKSQTRIGCLPLQGFLHLLTSISTAVWERTQSKCFQISTKTLLLSNFWRTHNPGKIEQFLMESFLNNLQQYKILRRTQTKWLCKILIGIFYIYCQ